MSEAGGAVWGLSVGVTSPSSRPIISTEGEGVGLGTGEDSIEISVLKASTDLSSFLNAYVNSELSFNDSSSVTSDMTLCMSLILSTSPLSLMLSPPLILRLFLAGGSFL